MRVAHLQLLLAAMVAPALALAAQDPASSAPLAAEGGAQRLAAARPAPHDPVPPADEIPSGRWRGSSRFGLTVGAGFPDFATASLLYRASERVRIWAGPSWSSVAWGLQGGVALVPWSSFVAPVLALEAGRFFRSDLSAYAGETSGVPSGAKPLLESVDFAFATLGVGLDLGSPRGLSLGVRVGISYVSVASSGTATFDAEGASGAQVRLTDPSLRGTLPSAKVALQYWF